MFISEKFERYYRSLSDEDKIEAMKVVNMLCQEHEKMMDDKHKKLVAIGTIANELLFRTLTGGATTEISERMRELKKEAERISKCMSIERYIEIHFGL